MRLSVSKQLQTMNRSNVTREDILSVKASFDRMWPRSNTMADLFYDRLFEISPDCRLLFRSDMTALKGKFISTLAVLVGSLDNVTGLLSITGKLAENHVHYGVKAEHYSAVGDALLWSLAQGLDDFWTAEIESSWQKTYGFISARMIAAAYH